MAHHRESPPSTIGTDRPSTRFASTLELDRVGAGSHLTNRRRIANGFDLGSEVVRHPGHVGDHQRPLAAHPPHGPGVMQHLVHCHGQRAGVAQQDVAQRISRRGWHRRRGFLGHRGRNGVVGRQHDQGWCPLALRSPERPGRSFRLVSGSTSWLIRFPFSPPPPSVGLGARDSCRPGRRAAMRPWSSPPEPALSSFDPRRLWRYLGPDLRSDYTEDPSGR